MIFQFPNVETLHIALSSGMVPAEVSQTAATVAFDAAGRPSVGVETAPPKAVQTALKRLGVVVGKTQHASPREVASWPALLPIEKESGTPEIAPSTPVLFEMPIAQLGTIAPEMMRLGNDRQSFRALTPIGSGEGAQRALLRVIGPPFYTLLRALDHLNADLVAYVEKAPRVWIEVGFTHPLVARLHVPEGQLLFLRPPHHWTALKDESFRDIYEIVDFQLPVAAIELEENAPQSKLKVPLRLVPGDAAAAPDLWILANNAVEIFDAFVNSASSSEIGRLMFAVAQNGASGPTIILRKRPSKLAAPAVVLEGAHGYVADRRLNNLYLPVGTRLRPTLRRDTLRKMLAENPAQIVWLTPQAEGRFTPETLPDEAFRPLSDWVDYIIDHEQVALENWMQASRFEFESYICNEERPQSGSKPPPPERSRNRKQGDQEEADRADVDVPQETKEKKKPEQSKEAGYSAVAHTAPHDELKKKRTTLEDAFLAVEGPLDAPERLALWPQLAEINTLLDDHAEAFTCWLNSLWESDERPARPQEAWLRSENVAGDVSPAEFDRVLAIESPTQSDLSRFVAMFLVASSNQQSSLALRERLPAIRHHLEKHEQWLGVRAIWLAWLHVCKINGDVLALARVRDRLVERLLNSGLQKEFDIPRFARFAGHRESSRLRLILESAHRIREAARKWTRFETASTTEMNGAYIDLMFSFGFAALGEIVASRSLLNSASSVLSQIRDRAGERDGAHALLLEGFRHRIEQAISGKPHRGPLPANWHEAGMQFKLHLAQIKEGTDPRKTAHYVVERFREQSAILEPEERLNPYRRETQSVSEFNREFISLTEVRDPAQLALRIKKLLGEKTSSKYSPEQRLEIAKDVLPLCPRSGADSTRQVLEQVIPILAATKDSSGQPGNHHMQLSKAASEQPRTNDIKPSKYKIASGQPRNNDSQPAKNNDTCQPRHNDIKLAKDQARLLERALVLAVNYDMPLLVKHLYQEFDCLLNLKSDEALFEVIGLTATQCLRSLRKNGMRDEIQTLLARMTAVIQERGAGMNSASATPRQRSQVLRAKLQVADAWLYFGEIAQALPIIDEVRDFLFSNSPSKPKDPPWHREYSLLARSYISAVSQGRIQFALERIEELFRKASKVANTFTSASHYSQLHLNVIEEVIVSIMNPSAAMGESARHWLDDDEYLVRRRIHRDMRRQLVQIGL